MRHRWVVFLAALAGSAVLATGFALAVDRATALRAPAPRLTTLPAGALARAGFSLSAALVPPYCGAAQEAARHGVLPSGVAACPISREQAERAAGGSVVEAVLANVTGDRHGAFGQGRPAWVVVTRPRLQVMFLCVGVAVGPNCPPGTTSVTAGQAVVFVDAYSGRVVDVVPVVTGGQQIPIRVLPVPPIPPIQPPLVTPAPRPPPVVTDDPSGS